MKITKRKKTWSALDMNKVYSLSDAIETLRVIYIFVFKFRTAKRC